MSYVPEQKRSGLVFQPSTEKASLHVVSPVRHPVAFADLDLSKTAKRTKQLSQPASTAWKNNEVKVDWR